MLLTPLLRGRRNDHIGCGTLKDPRLENVENLTNPLEHSELVVPLTHIDRRRNPRLSSDRGNQHTKLRQSFLRKAIHALKDVGNLLLGTNDDSLPRAHLRIAREHSQGRGLVEKFAGTRTLVGSDLNEDLFAQTHTSTRRRLGRRQVSENLEGIKCADPKLLEGAMQVGRVGRKCLANTTQTSAHLCDLSAVLDRGQILRGMNELKTQRRIRGVGTVDTNRGLVHAQVAKATVHGQSPRRRSCNMDHRATIRGAIGNNRRDQRSIIRSRWCINDEGMTIRDGLDNVLLLRRQVTGTAFLIGVTVTGV